MSDTKPWWEFQITRLASISFPSPDFAWVEKAEYCFHHSLDKAESHLIAKIRTEREASVVFAAGT